MSNKQQLLVLHNSFAASCLSIIEEIVDKNLELGTVHVIRIATAQSQTFRHPQPSILPKNEEILILSRVP